jgi:predicted alpha-1,2-mannosidase
MYRSYTARTIWSDVNGKYVDMCEEVEQLEDPASPVYGADAFWNTFWNLNQLWMLASPEVTNRWVRSLLEMYDQGGWLPKGPTGVEYSSIMVASHEIPLIVAAYQKGIRGYDVEKAYEAIRHNQTEPGRKHTCGGYVGNRQLKAYKKLGYVPSEEGPVSNTLEYAYDDFAVAQMARALGKDEDYEYFMNRAENYRNVFDSTSGYVRPRHADGTWSGNSDPTDPQFSPDGFVEGNAWQYTFFAPHDVQGVIDQLGGREPFVERLSEGFERSKGYQFAFSKAGEMAEGLYVNHGNQPNMQAAYLFNHAGVPWLTQKWARAIMDRYYGTGPLDGWLGDEDQGQMGAWFVMSAIGLFQMDGGVRTRPVYEIGSPLFEKVTIHLNEEYYDGETFVVEARNASQKNKYVQSATLDGEPLEKPWFYAERLTDGGRLVLQMGAEPNKKWGRGHEKAPPSMRNR